MSHLRKSITTCFLALSLITSNAQTADSHPDAPEYQKSHVTFDLFSSLNNFNPRWKVGYIKSLDPRWKIGLNLGYGNRDIAYTYFANKFEEDFMLWEIRPEVYRVFSRIENRAYYFSLELFYINHTDVFHNKYYYSEDYGEISFDRAGFQRHKYGFNVNVGQIKNLGRHFGINVFTGLGLRIRDVFFSNIINPRPTETFIDMIDFNEYRKDEGLALGLNYSVGLKLLFR